MVLGVQNWKAWALVLASVWTVILLVILGGRFQVATSPTGVFRVDRLTGAVVRCLPAREVGMDSPEIYKPQRMNCDPDTASERLSR